MKHPLRFVSWAEQVDEYTKTAHRRRYLYTLECGHRRSRAKRVESEFMKCTACPRTEVSPVNQVHFHIGRLCTVRTEDGLDRIRALMVRSRRTDGPPVPQIVECDCLPGEEFLSAKERQESTEPSSSG